MPSFVFASLLQYCLTFLWPIFPTLYNAQAPNVWQAFHSMILPITALSLGPIATIARYLRGERRHFLERKVADGFADQLLHFRMDKMDQVAPVVNNDVRAAGKRRAAAGAL